MMTNSCIARGVRSAGQVAVAAVAISACLPTSLAAQVPPGWVFSPGIAVAGTWDNNVALSSENSGSTGDFLTAITPRAVLSFRGRQTTFEVNYLGAFSLYQELPGAEFIRSPVEFVLPLPSDADRDVLRDQQPVAVADD